MWSPRCLPPSVAHGLFLCACPGRRKMAPDGSLTGHGAHSRVGAAGTGRNITHSGEGRCADALCPGVDSSLGCRRTQGIPAPFCTHVPARPAAPAPCVSCLSCMCDKDRTALLDRSPAPASQVPADCVSWQEPCAGVGTCHLPEGAPPTAGALWAAVLLEAFAEEPSWPCPASPPLTPECTAPQADWQVGPR